jgi:hypothetical protein
MDVIIIIINIHIIVAGIHEYEAFKLFTILRAKAREREMKMQMFIVD